MNPNSLALLALLAVGACGEINDSATAYTPSSSRLATSGNDEVPRRAPVVAGAPAHTASAPAAASTSSSVALAPAPASALHGSGRLEPAGSSTLVHVDLVSGGPHTTYEGTVRRGRCSAIGPTVTSLVPVTVDSLGAGRSASQVGVPIANLQGAPHVLVFGRGGRVETCGTLAPSIAPPA